VPAARTSNKTKRVTKSNSFENIWEKYVIPLEGNTIKRPDGKTNKIEKVDWFRNMDCIKGFFIPRK
jgi:hypothetical protein